MGEGMSWTDERTEKLKTLWNEGLSASQIAGRIGGVTRNGVIGKVHRLGLSGRTTTSRLKRNRQRPRKPSPQRATFLHGQAVRRARIAELKQEAYHPPREPLPPPNPGDIATKTFAEIEADDCRFIPADPRSGGKMFCGHPVVPGTSWCAHHLQRVSAAPVTRAPFVPVRKVPADVTKAVDELLGDREHA